jgi:hypothetical protein
MSNLLPTIEPHAARLEAAADAMLADGIGGDPTSGHAVVLRKMASEMRADAARGRLSGTFNAAAQRSYGISGALMACKAAGVAVPETKRFSSLYELDQALSAAFKNDASPLALQKRIELKNKIFAAGMVADGDSPVNEKQVIGTARLLNKFKIPIQVHSLASINAELDARPEISPSDRISIKHNMILAGLLDSSDGNIAPPRPQPNVQLYHSVLAQLGLDVPAPGKKVSIGILNAAMKSADLPIERRIAIKSTLSAGGFLD